MRGLVGEANLSKKGRGDQGASQVEGLKMW